MTGRPAFQARDYQELLEKNRKGIIRARGKRWQKLSQEGISCLMEITNLYIARNLIQGLTEINLALRMPLSEALNHVWLTLNLPNVDKNELAEYNFK